MNITTAADLTVHEYKGGSESLGPLVGISAAVLRNKVNPNNTTHHLTLAEADRIVRMTGDARILAAFAHSNGFLLVKAPESCGESDISVLEEVAGLMVAHGTFGRRFTTPWPMAVLTSRKWPASRLRVVRSWKPWRAWRTV